MSFFTRYSYLTANARANLLKGYHYEGSDASLFSMLLQPFWEASARLIPTHTAPNLITALGFIGSVIAYFTMIYYNPTLNNGTTTPSWVYYLCAFLLFYYQTIDAVDGKHARNTKSSSAMGELFDHGLDALNCLLQVTIIVATLQLGPTMYSCICVFVMYITSYLVIWEDYVTDELRFGMLNSPTEALLAAAGLLVFTGLVGGRIWTETYIFGIALQQIIVGACLLMGISVVYDSLKIVLTKAKSQKIHRAVEIGGSQGAINALVPFFGTVLLFVIYSFVAPELYTLYPITFLSTYGLLGSYMQTRMILARVCRETTPIFYTVVIPLPFIVLNAALFGFQLVVIQYAYFLFISVCYLHLVWNVLSEMMLVLGLECFTLTKHQSVPEGFDALTSKKQK